MNNEYGYRIKNVTIVYFFRDSLKRDPVGFDLPLDKNLAAHYLNRSSILMESIRAKLVPDKIGGSSDKCKYCMYKSYCEKDEMLRKEAENVPLRVVSSFKL